MNRFTLKCILFALVAATTFFETTQAQLAAGELPVAEITPVLSVRYRALRTSGSGAFMYIGTPDLTVVTNRQQVTFAYLPRIDFVISYDRIAGTFTNTTRTVNGSGTTVSTQTSTINNIMTFVGTVKAGYNNKINYMQMHYKLNHNNGDNGQVTIENLTLNGSPMGGTYQGSVKKDFYFYHLDVNFSNSFTITGTMRLSGTFNNGQDANILEFTWGNYSAFSTLPLGFTAFKGTAESNKRNKLTWKTDDNNEGKYFEVQRSEDGQSYSSIGTVQVSEERQTGNYTFYDTRPLSNAWYRIKAVDINNKLIYSAAIRVNQRLSETRVLQQAGSTELLFPDVQIRSVIVYNMAGVVMQKGNSAGINYTINHQNLKKGVYVFRVNGTHDGESRQFVVL
ncbi:T9SS type A sorting domain-containing protein [Flavihumibacter solisilvae]|uniref:Secretion system C-terminal sorting domain-containing protein n=1 Tax=Flavihumibacter solisilvae TaxID=1349421 RepID=A0A0C1LMC3_9BACT|nr:T9SS type A sorting domain-containing protein [Flavihumibacter solisilvae]KIC96478.1 hypothetical protein OI18_01760 [Flavihumibacter solisilvae]